MALREQPHRTQHNGLGTERVRRGYGESTTHTNVTSPCQPIFKPPYGESGRCRGGWGARAPAPSGGREHRDRPPARPRKPAGWGRHRPRALRPRPPPCGLGRSPTPAPAPRQPAPAPMVSAEPASPRPQPAEPAQPASPRPQPAQPASPPLIPLCPIGRLDNCILSGRLGRGAKICRKAE